MDALSILHLRQGSTMNGSVLATLEDIPDSLPAEGGDADTLQGNPASAFALASHVGSGGSAHSLATIAVSGFMSAAQVAKLNNISVQANRTTASSTNGNIVVDGGEVPVYEHPASHPASMIIEDASHRFVTDIQIANWDDQAFVEHTHDIGDVTGLQSALDSKETSLGAQEKADTAESEANAYTNSYAQNAVSTGSAADPNATQTSYILTNHANSPGLGVYWHINTYFFTDRATNLAQIAVSYNDSNTKMMMRHRFGGVWSSWQPLYSESVLDTMIQKASSFLEEYLSNYDAENEVFLKIEYKRRNDVLFLRSTLSNLVGGYYTTVTWEFFDAAAAPLATLTWTLAYDANGNVTSRTIS